MTQSRTVDADRLDALLARAQAALPQARARFEGLVAAIADQLPDPRHARDVGRMLDEIARGKLYRLAGHASLDDFLRDALGISRTTAYRLRRIARAPDAGSLPRNGKMLAYEAVRAAEARQRARKKR